PPDDEDRLLVDAEGEVVPRVRQLGGEARTQPLPGEDPAALQLEEVRAPVDLGRQPGGPAEGGGGEPRHLGHEPVERRPGPGRRARPLGPAHQRRSALTISSLLHTQPTAAATRRSANRCISSPSIESTASAATTT